MIKRLDSAELSAKLQNNDYITEMLEITPELQNKFAQTGEKILRLMKDELSTPCHAFALLALLNDYLEKEYDIKGELFKIPLSKETN